MRLFVAVNLPAAERRGIAGSCRALTESRFPVRWVREDLFHLTLKFLGDTSRGRRRELDRVLGGIAAQNRPFEMFLGGVGAFPNLERPRVLWMGVDPSPALRCLRDDVEAGLGNMGFEREEKRFHPHVTLGRVKRQARPRDLRGLGSLAAGVAYSASVPVGSLDLMESRLSPSGPRYSVLTSYRLGEEG